MNLKKMSDNELIILTEAIIVSATLRAAMGESAIKDEFYHRFKNVNLDVYSEIIKYENICLSNFITVSQGIYEYEREKYDK